MLTFNELKPIISKCCSTKQTTNLSEKYHFSIDFKKLEDALIKENADLHVMAFRDSAESVIPGIFDIQMLSEYAHKQENTSDLFFNDTIEFISFMLFSTKEGELFKENGQQPLQEEELYTLLNTGVPAEVAVDEVQETEIDLELVNEIIDSAPIYRVVVIKRFNQARDRFDYNIFFRSNNEMFSYVASKNS